MINLFQKKRPMLQNKDCDVQKRDSNKGRRRIKEKPFQFYSEVTGSSFIGRKKLLQQYKKWFFNDSKSISVSLIGLAKIGKTSFIKKVFEDPKKPEYIIYSYSNVKLSTTYEGLWRSIMKPIQEYLKNHNRNTKDVDDDFQKLENNKLEWGDFINVIQDIFHYLTKQDLKTIMVLDEFDYAAELFNSETQKYELFRTVISNPNYKLSAILISRRTLHEIEGKTYQCSTFNGVFADERLNGFDETDLLEYFNVFEKKKINLSDAERQEIQRSVGNLPYLLSFIGDRIIERKKESKDIIISEIIKDILENDRSYIDKYYPEILAQLEREDKKNKLISFVFDIELTRADIVDLINRGYIQTPNNKKIAISEDFEKYLRRKNLNKPDWVGEEIWCKILKTEKAIKELLVCERDEMKSAHNITSNKIEIIEKNILEKTDKFNIAPVENNRKKNREEYNHDSSYFETLTLSEAFKVIVAHWEIFKKYFGSNSVKKKDDKEIWDNKFNLILSIRNAFAHNNNDLPPEYNIRAADCYCSEILDLIAKYNSKHSNCEQKSANNVVSSCSKITPPSSQLSQSPNKTTGEVINSSVSTEKQTGKLITVPSNKNKPTYMIESKKLIYNFDIKVAKTKRGIAPLVDTFALKAGPNAEFDIEEPATADKAGSAINVVIDI